jgi:hypothetical protein
MSEVLLYGLSIQQCARYSYMGLVFYNERGIPNVLTILQWARYSYMGLVFYNERGILIWA